MTKNKMNELYNKSQEIVKMMNGLGINNYASYTIKSIYCGNFLLLNNTCITPTLKDTYTDDNLDKYIPATTLETMKQFELDLNDDIFSDLEYQYAIFIK